MMECNGQMWLYLTLDKRNLSGLKITTQEVNTLETNYGHEIHMRIVVNKFDSRTSLSHEALDILKDHPVYKKKMYKTDLHPHQ